MGWSSRTNVDGLAQTKHRSAGQSAGKSEALALSEGEMINNDRRSKNCYQQLPQTRALSCINKPSTALGTPQFGRGMWYGQQDSGQQDSGQQPIGKHAAHGIADW